MKHHCMKAAALAILITLAATTLAQSDGTFSNGTKASIDGAGRNVMRTAEGGIVAAFLRKDGGQSHLVFSRSVDNGKTWNDVVVDKVTGTVQQVAVDSNFQGSYVAFTEQSHGKSVGRIAYFAAPFASDAACLVSQGVTPVGVVPYDTFIQASRAGWGSLAAKNRETVVYGWQDANSKGLYIGVSPDGRTFPMARLVVSDSYAKSGPAVAIRGNFVIATYLTANPAMAPTDVPLDIRKGRSYPAWIESNDGGATWSQPLPLFGFTSAAFPTIKVKLGAEKYQVVRLAGGTSLPNSPILNWSSARTDDRDFLSNADKTISEIQLSNAPSLTLQELDLRLGGTTFVQSSMMDIDIEGKHGEVSIVSFRPIEPNAKWTHVIANNMLTTEPNALTTTVETDRRNAATVLRLPLRGQSQVLRAESVSANLGDVSSVPAGSDSTAAVSKFKAITSEFQYSALIDTPVRATIYKEFDVDTGLGRLVAAVSTDTGKNFTSHLSFGKKELASLGIDDFNKTTIFAASQCLFEDRNGEVYVDIIVADDNAIRYARIPIGVNAAKLRTVK